MKPKTIIEDIEFPALILVIIIAIPFVAIVLVLHLLDAIKNFILKGRIWPTS
jgi:hypothetical protein